MKVLFALEAYLPHLGGEEVRVHNLASRLPRAWEVHVAAPRFDGLPTEELDGRVIVHRLGAFESESYFANGSRPFFQSLLYGLQLRKFLASSEGFDAVMFGQWNMLHHLLAKGRVQGRVVVDWCEVLSGEISGLRGVAESFLENGLARGAERHLVTNSVMAQRLSRVHAVPRNRIEIVENGVSEQLVLKTAPRKEKGLVLYVGRLAPHKRVELLLDAVDLLSSRGEDISLHIVGTGSATYVDRLKSRGGRRATFLGALPEEKLREEYGSAQVLALPSQREGSSLVSLEAMGSWTPVVTVDSPLNYSSHDMILDGYNGKAVGATPTAMAEGLWAILSDGQAYVELSKNAQATASERTWGRSAARLAEVLCAVDAGEPRGA